MTEASVPGVAPIDRSTNDSRPLPIPAPDVIFRLVGDGAVLLATEREIYYGLNEVGAQIWELLPPNNADLNGLCASLKERYSEVDASELREDVLSLLADLEKEGLVRAPGSAADPGSR